MLLLQDQSTHVSNTWTSIWEPVIKYLLQNIQGFPLPVMLIKHDVQWHVRQILWLKVGIPKWASQRQFNVTELNPCQTYANENKSTTEGYITWDGPIYSQELNASSKAWHQYKLTVTHAGTILSTMHGATTEGQQNVTLTGTILSTMRGATKRIASRA